MHADIVFAGPPTPFPTARAAHPTSDRSSCNRWRVAFQLQIDTSTNRKVMKSLRSVKDELMREGIGWLVRSKAPEVTRHETTFDRRVRNGDSETFAGASRGSSPGHPPVKPALKRHY